MASHFIGAASNTPSARFFAIDNAFADQSTTVIGYKVSDAGAIEPLCHPTPPDRDRYLLGIQVGHQLYQLEDGRRFSLNSLIEQRSKNAGAL
jgi:hypothetical protein